MEIKINKLQINNFKGIKSFEMQVEGKNAVIQGMNGAGKTSAYDAFLWLLFGKDSEGKKDFGLRPVDKAGNVIPKLVLSVEAQLEIDGKAHTFRKEHHEKVVKKELRGYEVLCWIDEVPKKVSEYADYINDVVSEDTFKLLTDLHFFNERLHWKDRRAVLLQIAGGNIQAPEGFEELISELKDRTVDEYKSVLAEQKKRLSKEREEIEPRVDELQKSLEDYAEVEQPTIEKDREAAQKELAELDKKRKDILSAEAERQVNIETVSSIKKAIADREIELDRAANADPYADKKKEINDKLEQCLQKLQDYKFTAKALELELQEIEQHRKTALDAVAVCRKKYIAIKEAKGETTTCYACGRELPEDKLAEMADKKKAELAEVIRRGNLAKKGLDETNAKIEEVKQAIKEAKEAVEKQQIEYKEGEEYREAIFAEFATKAEKREVAYSNDGVWAELNSTLKEAEAVIGEPTSKQLKDIEENRLFKQDELNALNKLLANADNAKKNKSRIKELLKEEKALSAQITGIDKMLDMIGDYKAAESKLIEEAVNSKFEHVKFKLFKTLLNGSIEDTCETTLYGVSYSDMSYGQRILAGVDIINVLSKHYDSQVVLFIDNSESLTLPIQPQSQVIRLMAVVAKKLTVSYYNEGEIKKTV